MNNLNSDSNSKQSIFKCFFLNPYNITKCQSLFSSDENKIGFKLDMKTFSNIIFPVCHIIANDKSREDVVQTYRLFKNFSECIKNNEDDISKCQDAHNSLLSFTSDGYEVDPVMKSAAELLLLKTISEAEIN